MGGGRVGVSVAGRGWKGVKVTVGLAPGALRIGARGSTAPQARIMALIKAKPVHPKTLALPTLSITNEHPCG